MSKKQDPINLDLINMVQNARMQHDKTATPSQVGGVYWVEAKRITGDYPPLTPRTGEWQIPTSIEVVDEWWARIKQATEDGKLSYKSKVSTAAAHGQSNPTDRLICVRTYDADDSADVERVRQALVELGFEPLTYMRDKE